MTKPLYVSDQETFTIGNQPEEIPECLRIAFSVREHLEKLFNTAQSWNSLFFNCSLKDFNFFQSVDLKKFSEKLTQLILWSEPHISDSRILRWNTNKSGFLHCTLLLKLYNCKPLRLHIRLEGLGKNRVDFWT